MCITVYINNICFKNPILFINKKVWTIQTRVGPSKEKEKVRCDGNWVILLKREVIFKL